MRFLSGGPKPFLSAVVAIVTSVVLGGGPLWAADASGDWRATYDLVMRWVNFGVLAGLIVYFGRRPVANLLGAQAARHEDRIHRLEEERDSALQRLAEAQRVQAESEGRLAGLQERIVALGEQQREALIADAQRQGELLIAAAQRRIGMAVRAARRQLRDEMVDLAVSQALDRLPETVTPEDDAVRLAHFFTAVNRVR